MTRIAWNYVIVFLVVVLSPFLLCLLLQIPMSQSSVFFVGQPGEVAHHAAPFQSRLNVLIGEPHDVSKKARPGDLAIFYSEHFDRFRDACQRLRQNNVATLYMIDGILEWRNAWENSQHEVACPYTMRPVLAHKVACIGNSQARVLESWGNHGKTEVIGIPRLDGYSSRYKRRQPDPHQFRVLVMTAKSPAFTEQQLGVVRQSLMDLKTWHDGNREYDGRSIEFVWRLTGDLANEIGVVNQLSDLTGVELAQSLSTVDAVITTPSTALLEAMLLDLPVAVLDYHNCPHYVTSGWDICCAAHIGPTLAQLASRPETRLMFQRSQLDDALNLQGDATERLVELVRQMLKIAADQVNANLPLEFPAQILAPVNATPTEFCHQRLFENAPEFSNDEPTLLQVELSHARREISHLHRELAQVHSELDQAHQIFEQINKHPIAGPIVRIRQKMLDLMAAIRKRKNKIDPDPDPPADPPSRLTESSSN